jgi:hypothetical protein
MFDDREYERDMHKITRADRISSFLIGLIAVLVVVFLVLLVI